MTLPALKTTVRSDAPWWKGEEDSPVTYPLYVHLAIAGAIVLGFYVGWFLLPAVERWAVSR